MRGGKNGVQLPDSAPEASHGTYGKILKPMRMKLLDSFDRKHHMNTRHLNILEILIQV